MLPPEFHFLRPGWLLLLPLIPVLLFWLARARRDRRRWEAVCDPALLPHVLLAAPPQDRRRWPGVLIGLAALLGVTALAGPAWERLPQPVFRSESAVVVALDLSRSMAASDLSPSRLERARYALRDLLSARREGQTGLVVFAADAFVVSPLTDDVRTIEAQVPALEPDLMPTQGSRPERAIELAARLLSQAGAGRGEILLLTDGAAEPAAAAQAAREAAALGYTVSVLGVGTATGAPVPDPDGGFVTDASGGIVIARLDADALGRLARGGDGVYAALDGGPFDAARLAGRWQRAGERGAETGRTADAWLDRGPWLAALIVPFALLGFRRGALALAACALLPLAPDARAAGWEDLWLRPDQRAAAALEAGDAAAASELFVDRRWRAAAAYRAQDYAVAAAALDGLDDPESLYNRGNALARAGRFEEAVRSYERALEQSPDHEDARHNLDLIRNLQQQSAGGGEGAPDQDGEGEPRPGDEARRAADGQDGQDGQRGGDPGERQAGSAGDEAGDSRDQAAGGENAQAAAGRAGRRGDPDRLGEAERAALERDAERARAQAQAGAPRDEPPAREDAPPGERDGGLAAASEPDEAAQATEQWLRRIPDDPGGLLRRKFYYQYRERGAGPEAREGEEAW